MKLLIAPRQKPVKVDAPGSTLLPSSVALLCNVGLLFNAANAATNGDDGTEFAGLLLIPIGLILMLTVLSGWVTTLLKWNTLSAQLRRRRLAFSTTALGVAAVFLVWWI